MKTKYYVSILNPYTISSENKIIAIFDNFPNYEQILQILEFINSHVELKDVEYLKNQLKNYYKSFNADWYPLYYGNIRSETNGDIVNISLGLHEVKYFE